MVHTPAATRAAPPTWGTAAPVTKPAATTGGASPVSATAAAGAHRGERAASVRAASTSAAHPANM